MMLMHGADRGHIGIHAFSYIVQDPRLKGIPMILETPTSESPDVWKKEIEVLHRLAGSELKEDEMTRAVEEIKAVSGAASGASQGSKSGTRGGKAKKQGKRRKQEDESLSEPEDD